MCALSHGIPSLPSFASCVLSMFPGISHTIHVPRFLLLFLSLPRSSTYISCLTIITPATATHLHTVHTYPTTNASHCAESPLSTKNTVWTHSKSLASLRPNHFYSEKQLPVADKIFTSVGDREVSRTVGGFVSISS